MTTTNKRGFFALREVLNHTHDKIYTPNGFMKVFEDFDSQTKTNLVNAISRIAANDEEKNVYAFADVIRKNMHKRWNTVYVLGEYVVQGNLTWGSCKRSRSKDTRRWNIIISAEDENGEKVSDNEEDYLPVNIKAVFCPKKLEKRYTTTWKIIIYQKHVNFSMLKKRLLVICFISILLT